MELAASELRSLAARLLTYLIVVYSRVSCFHLRVMIFAIQNIRIGRSTNADFFLLRFICHARLMEDTSDDVLRAE